MRGGGRGEGVEEGVVYEAGGADPYGEGGEGGAGDGAGDGLEGFVIHDGDVVNFGVGGGCGDGFAHGGDEAGGVAFAGGE